MPKGASRHITAMHQITRSSLLGDGASRSYVYLTDCTRTYICSVSQVRSSSLTIATMMSSTYMIPKSKTDKA